MGSVFSRLERRGLLQRDAAKCRTQPHPVNRQFWQPGDYATPDQLVCGRCGAVLAQRRHVLKS
jgi:hypothetical protein